MSNAEISDAVHDLLRTVAGLSAAQTRLDATPDLTTAEPTTRPQKSVRHSGALRPVRRPSKLRSRFRSGSRRVSCASASRRRTRKPNAKPLVAPRDVDTTTFCSRLCQTPMLASVVAAGDSFERSLLMSSTRYLDILRELWDCRELIGDVQLRGAPLASENKAHARRMKTLLDFDLLDPYSAGSPKFRNGFLAMLQEAAPSKNFCDFTEVEIERVALALDRNMPRG